jgi:hypothetical protein
MDVKAAVMEKLSNRYEEESFVVVSRDTVEELWKERDREKQAHPAEDKTDWGVGRSRAELYLGCRGNVVGV